MSERVWPVAIQVTPKRTRRLLGGEVARGSGSRLQVARSELVLLHPLDMKVDPKRRAQATHHLFVGVGLGAKAVVDVKSVDALWPDGCGERSRGASRVGATGDEHDTIRVRIDEAGCFDGTLQRLKRSFPTHERIVRRQQVESCFAKRLLRAIRGGVALTMNRSIGWGSPSGPPCRSRSKLEVARVADRVCDRLGDQHLAAERAGHDAVGEVHIGAEVVAVAIDGAAEVDAHPGLRPIGEQREEARRTTRSGSRDRVRRSSPRHRSSSRSAPRPEAWPRRCRRTSRQDRVPRSSPSSSVKRVNPVRSTKQKAIWTRPSCLTPRSSVSM